MRASAKEFVGAKAKPFPDRPVLLFFGDDEGLASSLARQAVKQTAADLSDPFAVIRLSAEQVNADPGRLVAEASTLGLVDRTIWIDAGGSHSLMGLEEAMAEPPPNMRVVIVSGQLRRDSQLRRLCESSPRALAISCASGFGPDELRSELEVHGLALDQAAFQCLAELLPNDFLTRHSEIEKLEEYLGPARFASLEDIEAAISGAGEASADAAIDLAFRGDLRNLARFWRRCEELGLDPQALAAIALRILFFRTPGADPNHDPAVHGRRGVRAARRLFAALRDARRDGRVSNMIVDRAFLSLALSAGR